MVKAKQVYGFLRDDLWRIRLDEQSRPRSMWIKALRIIVLSFKGFDKDNCTLRASALTFYALLSIVPILAMAFGIAKGFGFDHILEQRVREQFQGQEEVLAHAITFARNMLDKTKGGLVAGIGVIFLFWTIIKVLGNMERSFNDIWGFKRQRSLMRKFSDYLSLMLVAPVLFLMASSMTIFVTSSIKNVLLGNIYFAFFSGPIQLALRLLPFAVFWGLFAFIYLFLPNGKVNFRSAGLGGIAAGTIYQIAQWGYITFQLGINHYNAIYGSFAALPLFLIWLQLSWLILLFGAEISFAHQNVMTYEFEQDCLKISPAFKRLIALAIVHLSVKRFREETPPLTANEISHELQTPVRLVNQIIFELVGAGVLSEVAENAERRIAFQPALDTENLTIQSVLNRIERRGIDNIPFVRSEAVEKLSSCLDEFRGVLAGSPNNVLLKDL
jgi:membrane protein